jgi:ribosomal protein S18 acetylase RimI-like enzyme
VIGRVLYHAAGLAFLAWVVLVPLKWAVLAGLAAFALYAWDTRPGGEDRARRAERARREAPVTADDRVRAGVARASTVTPRLVAGAWLGATVRASNPTNSAVELEAVSCRVLLAPDAGPRHEVWSRGPWRIRLGPGESHLGEVSFGRLGLAGSPPPVALAEHRCRLHVRVVPAPGGAAGLAVEPHQADAHGLPRGRRAVTVAGSASPSPPARGRGIVAWTQSDMRRRRMDGGALELRRAGEADAAAVRALTRAAYAEWVPVIGREPKPMTADYAEAVQKHRIDLLHVGGELAALVETIPRADHLLVENVAVAPAFRGRGLGRRLLAHAERLAAEGGYGEVRLYTNGLFAANVRLYLRLGYRTDREEAFRGGVVVHMSKPVAGGGGGRAP